MIMARFYPHPGLRLDSICFFLLITVYSFTEFNNSAGDCMSESLTERQTEILRLIKELTEVSGFPPTRAEIAERMGFRSVNAAEQHLRALERKGALEISAGSS